MKKILILANNDVGLYKFRKELIQELVKLYEVHISLPYGEYISQLQALGCNFIDTPISRRGTNPITDLKLLMKYRNIIKNVKPDVVLTYTIKPNIYGGIVCRISKTPYIANITGLGSALEKQGNIKRITLILYSIALKQSACVFFQNSENQQFFFKNKVVNGANILLPGSGVNLTEHCLEEYPPDENIRFLFIGRIMKEKGIDEYLQAAKVIKNRYPNSEFHIIGFCEENYEPRLQQLQQHNIIKLHGLQDDVHSYIKFCHAVVLPSHHEGMSNVLLEAAATGRPVVASDIPGCREIFDEGISGYRFEVKSVDDLLQKIYEFIQLSYETKKRMGKAGRKKVENEFDRQIVVNAYVEEIYKCIQKNINEESYR